MICDIICVDGFLCMSHLDIVHMLSAYVHVIHTLSGHMHIMRTLFAVVLDIFLPNRQCLCHPYIISSTLYISHHVQLSFCTLSAQMHIVHVICMLSTHVHIICFSFLTLLIYGIIHNLVFAHCLHTHTLNMSSLYCLCHFHVVRTCTHHLLVISNTPCIPYYPELSFCTYCLHTHTLSMSSVYCLQMYMLCTSHFYCCYLHMYMSSAYYLSICVLCTHNTYMPR